MSTSTELAIPQLKDTLALGETLYRSGYFGDVKSAAQAVVKVLRGQELGLGPVSSLEQIYVVKGKTALSAGLIGALIQRSGRYDYRVLALSEERCQLAFFAGGQEVGRSDFTWQDAQKAGLTASDAWQKYRRNMLFARALSNGARWYCPSVFGGAIYTPEELREAAAPVQEAEVVVVEAAPTAAPALEWTEEELAPEPAPLEEAAMAPPPPPPEPCSEAQRKKLFATAADCGVPTELLRAMMQERYQVTSSKELSKAQASAFIEYLLRHGKGGGAV